MYALNLSDDGRILSATFEPFAWPGQPLVESLPEGDIADYRYQDGKYVLDPLPVEEQAEKPKISDQIAELWEALDMLLSGVTE